MNNQLNAISQIQKQKCEHLRHCLDKMNFIHSFDSHSYDLVNSLYNKLVEYNNNIKIISQEKAKYSEKNKELELIINALKYKASSITKENEELHKEIISLMNKHSQYEENETLLKQTREENENMKFLINELKSKLKESTDEITSLKYKYEKLLTSLYDKTVSIKELFHINDNDSNNDNVLIIKPSFNISQPLSPNENFPTDSNYVFNNSYLQNNFKKENNTETSNLLNKETVAMFQSKIKELEKEINNKDDKIQILQKQIDKYFNCNIPQISSNSINSSNNNNSIDNDLISSSFTLVVDYLKNENAMLKEKYETYIKFLLDNQKNHYDTLNEYKINKTDLINTLKDQNEKMKFKLKQNQNLINSLQRRVDFLNEQINVKANQYKQYSVLNEITLSYCVKSKIKETPSKKDLKNEIVKQKDIIINELQTQNNELKKQILVMNEKINKLELEKIKMNKEYKDVKGKFEQIRDDVNKKEYSKLEGNMKEESLKDMVKMLEMEKKKFIEDVDKLNKELVGYEKKLQMVYKEMIIKNSEIARLNNLNTMLETQIKIFTKE